MDLLTAEDVAIYLKMSVSNAYILFRQPDFPTIRLGRLVRVRLGDLDAYLDKHKDQEYNPLYGGAKTGAPGG